MNKKIYQVFLLLLMTFTASSVNSLKGEKPILFEAKMGESSDAFEGSFMVPENRKNKDSRMIPIKYVRFPATGESPGSPIIYLAGGPGGSGIQTAKYWRFPLFMAMREFGDVIALDQRGTGASDITPECKSSQITPHDKVITDEQYVKMHQQALTECLQFWQAEGVDILGYTTPENVKDLDALRQHLGADKITLWGISYGSHLALAALKTMDDRIDKVVIASAEGLSQTIKMPKRTDAYFDRLQAAIDTQVESKKMFGDIKLLIRRVHDKLDRQPLKLAIPQKDGSIVDYLLQRKDVQMMASGLISDPIRAGQLLQLYTAIDNEITEPLIAVLQRYFKVNDPISYKPMAVAMDLASGMSEQKRMVIKQQAQTALLKDYLNFTYHLTDVLPAIDLGDEFRKAPRSSVPTLLLSGTLDGRTYIESQLQAVAGLRQLTAVKVINAGHNLFMSSAKVISPGVGNVIKQFMRNERVVVNEITIPLPEFSKR